MNNKGKISGIFLILLLAITLLIAHLAVINRSSLNGTTKHSYLFDYCRHSDSYVEATGTITRRRDRIR